VRSGKEAGKKASKTDLQGKGRRRMPLPAYQLEMGDRAWTTVSMN
jgi:hypothetical protein